MNETRSTLAWERIPTLSVEVRTMNLDMLGRWSVHNAFPRWSVGTSNDQVPKPKTSS